MTLWKQKFVDFLRKNPVPGTERVLKQTLEKIRIRSKLSKRLRQEFKNA